MSNAPQPPVVIVGVDASAVSERAVKWAADYVRQTGGTLRIVAAWAWPRMYGMSMVMPGFDLPGAAEAAARSAAAQADVEADQVDIQVCEGTAGDVLITACDGADLLVVGSHDEGPLGRAVLGSVSNYCIHHAPIPVVVVR